MSQPGGFSRAWTQFFPPKPTFVEKNMPDQTGRVHLVTGANTGLGKETARILYALNAKVYVAARSLERAQPAIDAIQKAHPNSKGQLVFLQLDLSDLAKVRSSALTFLAQEAKSPGGGALHVLYNNAGAMGSDPLRRTAQGHELTIGVNSVGTFLFTELLTPILQATAKRSLPSTNAVRVIWLSSYGLESAGVEGAGVPLDNLEYDEKKGTIPKALDRYAISKAGTWALGVEYARRHRQDNIVSMPINPGNLQTELARDMGSIFRFMVSPLCYPIVNGASTVLFAGLSPDVTLGDSGGWIIPFGRIYPLKPSLVSSTKPESEGGTGGVAKFWAWNEDQVKAFL
ncbi:short-chain alcohol dehydrogenase [Sporothrix eucalyptigena]|uniref:Short-chain alcohol dehydrogenase n=1 Tax=Sporothrix eucalyptigena TaxID=1812306 RepID=A0ABP0CQD4_9PEZI